MGWYLSGKFSFHALSFTVMWFAFSVSALRLYIRAASLKRRSAGMHGLAARMQKMPPALRFYDGFAFNICTVWNKKCNFALKQLVGLSLELVFQRKVRATESIPLLNGKSSVRVK